MISEYTYRKLKGDGAIRMETFAFSSFYLQIDEFMHKSEHVVCVIYLV